jgi:hypothetical protein
MLVVETGPGLTQCQASARGAQQVSTGAFTEASIRASSVGGSDPRLAAPRVWVSRFAQYRDQPFTGGSELEKLKRQGIVPLGPGDRGAI